MCLVAYLGEYERYEMDAWHSARQTQLISYSKDCCCGYKEITQIKKEEKLKEGLNYVQYM